MIPKIFVIMVWIMVIGVQADPKGKVYANGKKYSQKSFLVAKELGLKDDCRAIMGDCTKSCPYMGNILTDPDIDACAELDKVRKGCFSTCPPCAHEGLAKLEEDFWKKNSTCKASPIGFDRDFIVGNVDTLCANEATIRNEKECEKAAKLYGKDLKTTVIGSQEASRRQGGCSIMFGDKVVFNYGNYGFINHEIKPICRRKETLEEKAKDELFKEMIQTISTAKENKAQIKENKAQISILGSKVNALVDLKQFGQMKFMHQGHCGSGSGWLHPNSKQETVDDCLKKCKSRDGAKYFAYSSGKQNCACYKTDCKSDGRHMDHMSYEILRSG